MAPINLRGTPAADRLRFAALVQPARSKRGMSQAELAKAAGVDRTTISNIERGAGAPQEDILRRVFAALGIVTDEDDLDTDVELWLAVMGSLLTSIPRERRHFAAESAIATLSAHVEIANTIAAEGLSDSAGNS